MDSLRICPVCGLEGTFPGQCAGCGSVIFSQAAGTVEDEPPRDAQRDESETVPGARAPLPVAVAHVSFDGPRAPAKAETAQGPPINLLRVPDPDEENTQPRRLLHPDTQVSPSQVGRIEVPVVDLGTGGLRVDTERDPAPVFPGDDGTPAHRWAGQDVLAMKAAALFDREERRIASGDPLALSPEGGRIPRRNQDRRPVNLPRPPAARVRPPDWGLHPHFIAYPPQGVIPVTSFAEDLALMNSSAASSRESIVWLAPPERVAPVALVGSLEREPGREKGAAVRSAAAVQALAYAAPKTTALGSGAIVLSASRGPGGGTVVDAGPDEDAESRRRRGWLMLAFAGMVAAALGMLAFAFYLASDLW